MFVIVRSANLSSSLSLSPLFSGPPSACLDLFGIVERTAAADVLPLYYRHCFLVIHVLRRS